MAMIHASHVGFYAVLVLWVLAQRLTCLATDDLEKLAGDAVALAMHNAHVTVKEGAACCGIDEAQFRKQLRGEPHNHLSLSRLLRLPYTVWLHLGPALIFIVAKRRWAELAEDFGVKRSA